MSLVLIIKNTKHRNNYWKKKLKTKRIELDQISLAIEDIKCGKPVIVVDDENRENEGDFVVAAEKITPEIVNFLAKEGRGLICAPLTASRCE